MADHETPKAAAAETASDLRNADIYENVSPPANSGLDAPQVVVAVDQGWAEWPQADDHALAEFKLSAAGASR
jgi:hypothetical protein